eukprot:NODE_429_length_1499_cov_1649.004828_g317_i0.p1 GENE.NODE_429_length_1499_cov_1649.004828_g317_i0~~NODE_429_length_1499_cov_1649.004828_g317_i0.p1  ORF type:complete len:393 (-),score=221.11 NODE_429_length_1499_cov_1649.004828_g317_i0:224-1402(-)
MKLLAFIAIFAIIAECKVYFKETFDGDWESRWTHSGKSDLGKFKVSAGKFYADAEKSKGLQTSQDAKFYAISAPIPEPFSNDGKTLVLQFEVKHEQNIDCGGGYIKLLPKTTPTKFEGESPYYIMFGPDICGATKKVHLIFNYKGKNLLWKKEPRCEGDQFTHLYTLVLKPDHSYEVHIDGSKKESGTLEEDWEFLKPKTIADPDDKKPDDWVDEAELDDPADVKPADWDKEPEQSPEPSAKQPDDWEEEEEGKWEPPMVANPKYKGEWKPKRIPNPAYKGVWAPKQIPNPEYSADENLHVYKDIATVGFDLWQVKAGTIFDNILVTDDVAEAKAFAKDTFEANKDKEKAAKDKQDEEQRKKDEEERKKNDDKKEDEEDDGEDEPSSDDDEL